jgi:hypothetical protein
LIALQTSCVQAAFSARRAITASSKFVMASPLGDDVELAGRNADRDAVPAAGPELTSAGDVVGRPDDAEVAGAGDGAGRILLLVMYNSLASVR